MDDGVEALVGERESTGARHYRRRPLADALGRGSPPCGPQPFLGQIREHDRAASDLREVQAGPPLPRPHVEQPAAVSQAESFRDEIGLRVGVAVRPEVAPDHDLL